MTIPDWLSLRGVMCLPHDITSDDCTQVHRAFAAVGIGGPIPPDLDETPVTLADVLNWLRQAQTDTRRFAAEVAETLSRLISDALKNQQIKPYVAQGLLLTLACCTAPVRLPLVGIVLRIITED